MVTSYDIEVACKNAIIEKVKETYNEDLNIQNLHLVWFTKSLQTFKCVIVDDLKNQRYYECTYNAIKKELYVDFYQKEKNFLIKNLKTKVAK
jgi:hypothetical protein